MEKSKKALLGQFFGFKSATNEVVDIVEIVLSDGLSIAQFRKVQEIQAKTLGVTLITGLVWKNKTNKGSNYTFECNNSFQQKQGRIPRVYALENELIDCIDP